MRRKPKSSDAWLADRVAKARAKGLGTEHYVLAAELAEKYGLDVNDVLDDYGHFAAIMEYDSNIPRAEAETRAWAQVVALHEKQEALAI